MLGFPLRKLDRLILLDFIPFFIMGTAAFTLLMVAVVLFKPMMKYVADFGLSFTQVGTFFIMALPQTVVYTFPMAILFATLLTFGRLSDTGQISALRAGGIGFFRIVLPALAFTWLIVLATFILNEKVAPQATLEANRYIQRAIVSKGITLENNDISYMDQDAGWLFAAASAQGNVFKDVKWWDFSRPGELTLYIAEEGVWESDEWVFNNARVIHLSLDEDTGFNSLVDGGEEIGGPGGNVVRSMESSKLEMKMSRTPSDILEDTNREPEEMSLQELRAFIRSDEMHTRSAAYARKIESTYHVKIAAPFAALVFTLLAAPLGLAPQRSTSTMGIGLSMLLVFAYYMLATFSIKFAESGGLNPAVAAWIPNFLFLIAGLWLNARFYIRSI